jgi:pimeloyl-[acyl-carrier protein] methyl ester esterase
MVEGSIRMSFVETSAGVNIHYEDIGSGRPLVLIHGWGGSALLWRFQRELAEDFRLIIPDLRGHGDSSGSAESFALEDLVRDVIALFEKLNLADAVLAGWSLGSQAAMASFPMLRKRLSGLVLVGATARFTTTEGYPHGLPADEIRGMGLRLKRGYERTMGDFFRSMFAEGELSPEMEDRIAREITAYGRLPEPSVARAGLSVLASADLREMLPEIDRPVLLIHGDKDEICPPEAARYLAKRLPKARLLEFAGAGHALPLSRPVEFNAHIREFLQETGHDRH